jgi:hypothetical protein
MIIYVHSYDIFDRGTTWGRHRGVTDLHHIILGTTDSVTDMVSRVIRVARNHGSIYTLIINAHGLVNEHGLPVGKVSLSDSDELSTTTATFMNRLAPYFSSPGNGLELHCCEVLGATEGWTMCSMLARNLGVDVYASSAVQRGVSPWYSSTPSDTWGRFEGLTYRFQPNGQYGNAEADLRARGLHE